MYALSPTLRGVTYPSQGAKYKRNRGLDRASLRERTYERIMTTATMAASSTRRWAMRGMARISCGLLSAALLIGCAAVPPSRLGDYVSPEQQVSENALTQIEQRPLKAGLVLVSDTAQPGATLNLPDEALVRFGETLKADIGRTIPVAITEVLPSDQIHPQPN